MRRYKYQREDFGELPVQLRHLVIHLNFLENCVEADNRLEMTAKQALDELSLDANSLEIIRIEWSGSQLGPEGEGGPLSYDHLQDQDRLILKFPCRIEAGESFWVHTVTRCFPSDHLLEGIYRDTTPPGAPQQYMSQCQQWGFQRIMPILDDCRAKCTMTTTIEADVRYTHLISNGNISRGLNPDGKPVLKHGDPTRQVITYENPVPMAPYLFLVCAGTWDTLADQVTYPSGRSVRLEYLAPPGRTEGARTPMEILKESVLWTGRTQNYEYTGDTYRTICMNKSNFGGMENVGNTTIVTDAALVDEHTLDHLLMYAHAVIVHEFEHNQCGSETTMETPFDVWLNEAYTVDVERQFMADLFDPTFIRLQQVDSIRHPLMGPLAIEDGGHAGRIVREGFNNPDELIDGVTYVKAAEVIRMLRLILGAEQFRAGKSRYFSRYQNGNANTDQFFACFEEVSGRSLRSFKDGWLYGIGYPAVTVATDYDPLGKCYRMRFRQLLEDRQKPFHLPIDLALVDRQGVDIRGTRKSFQLDKESAELILENISEAPAFASMHRDYSFYGTFQHENAAVDGLMLQTRLDPNPYNRVNAMRQLTDRERIKLLLDEHAEVGADWLMLYGEFLNDSTLPAALKAYFLRIDEQPLDRSYCTWYPELVIARDKLMRAVTLCYREQLVKHFKQLDTCSQSAQRSPKEGIEDRFLKQVLLDLIAVDDSPDSHQLILEHFTAASVAQDRFAALLALNRSSAPQRRTVLEEVYHAWGAHLSGYANYLRIIGSGAQPDVFVMIEKEKARARFDITQPTWCRALLLSMAVNTRMVWTDQGIQWVADSVLELAPINETTASRLLNTFQHARKLKPDLRAKVTAVLEFIVAKVNDQTSPTIHGQASAYLNSRG